MDAPTVAVYEVNAEAYRERRRPRAADRARHFDRGIRPGWRLDVGCGPGWYAEWLGRPLVSSDVTQAMCSLAHSANPDVPVVRHDLEALPFRRGTFAGVWAWKCLQHLPAVRLPTALAELHRALAVGARLELAVFCRPGDQTVSEHVSGDDDDFPGRLFTWWPPRSLEALLVGAGFVVDDLDVTGEDVTASVTRARTLPDIVAPGMRLLISGLNPSLYAADAGVAYARPGNRFWPAALDAGIASVDRDPWHALRHHGTGFTDLVKRATVGAGELSPEEYRQGLARLDHLAALVRPSAIAFCGLTGWRAATGDRRASPGWQNRTVGGVPAYVLPNPSGLNAHVSVADIAAHLRAAAASPV